MPADSTAQTPTATPTILKLGGSVITDKDSPETVNDAALDRAVDAIADASDQSGSSLVIVHGGGSFGHIHAAEYGVSTTEGSHDLEAVTTIHGAMKQLNRVVVDRLGSAGVPAVPVHPLSAASRDAAGELSLSATAVSGLLDEGFVPVLHGDVIAHAGKGVSVLSGDEVVTTLATSLGASRVGLCSTVPGVLDDDDEVIETIRDFESVTSVLGASESTDVSGGMAGKVRELLALATPACVFGPDDVSDFLAGGEPGTRIERR